ncbi:MAG: universal stress protein, partial [Dokdonella sp.]
MSAKAKNGMFKHVLIPTDGSKLSREANDKGVKFAKQIGAKVTGFHAIPEFRTFTGVAEMIEQTSGSYKATAKLEAKK